ncbi:MAG: hypothetical protein H0X12_07555 [Nocardioides sp.]|nr:hypothetical protein [Nocardioides sp.]
MRGATVRLPEGWEPDPTNTKDILVAAVTDVYPQTMGVVAFPETFTDLDTQVKQVRRQARGRIRYERMPDIYVAGARFYYLSGRDSITRRDWTISIGGNYGGLNYTVGFTLAGKSDAERAELVDSVLASWEWK